MIEANLRKNIIAALDDAVSFVRSGDSLKAAAVKAAAASDFNADQTRRFCEAFNTARALSFYEKHPEKRAEQFELIDPSEVVSELYSAEEAKEACKGDDNYLLYDYSEYYRPEVDFVMGKAASFDDTDAILGITNEKSLPSLEAQVGRAHDLYDSQIKAAEFTEDESRLVEASALDIVSKLASAITMDFDMNGSAKYSRFSAVIRNDSCVDSVKALDALLPERVVADKVAGLVEDRDLDSWKEEMYIAQDRFDSARNAKALAMTVKKEANEFLSKFNGLVHSTQTDPGEGVDWLFRAPRKHANQVLPAPQADQKVIYVNAPSQAKDKDNDKDENKNNNQQGPVRTAIRATGKAVASNTVAPLGTHTQKYVEDAVGYLRDQKRREGGKITDSLKNHQRQLILQDLVINDPFISEADPELISQGYNTLRRLAPELSTNKEVVRSIMRQLVHTGGLSVYDADAMAKLEKTILETAGKVPQRNEKAK
jgi:hypothetical protein